MFLTIDAINIRGYRILHCIKIHRVWLAIAVVALQNHNYTHNSKALIGRALILVVAVCYRSNILQELYVFDKMFNRMIGRAVLVCYLKLL